MSLTLADEIIVPPVSVLTLTRVTGILVHTHRTCPAAFIHTVAFVFV